jgi:D-sedoheptulose 7-phosphate isomerase
MNEQDYNPRSHAQKYLQESADLKQKVAQHCLESIIAAAGLITEAFQARKKVLLCGNGGSAADCQHMAAEFVSVLNKEFRRPGLPAIALTTDTSFITAFTNDFGFDGVFAQQVETLGVAGDVLIGISTSGTSPNVVRALEAARAGGLRTITLTGQGGQLNQLADVSIAVPGSETQHIQEAHLAIEHLICELVEKQLFPGAP